MTLRPGASNVVQFAFDVPNTVRDGTFVCAQVFVGQDRLQPFFNTVGQRDLFCILKGFTGGFSVASEQVGGGEPLRSSQRFTRRFSVVTEKEAQKMFRHLNGRMLVPSKGQ